MMDSYRTVQAEWKNNVRRSRKFCQRGSITLTYIFDEWSEDPNTTKSRPSSVFSKNSVSLASPWWPNIEYWLGSLVSFQGIGASISKKPYISVIFQDGPDPLWMRTCMFKSRKGPTYHRICKSTASYPSVQTCGLG